MASMRDEALAFILVAVDDGVDRSYDFASTEGVAQPPESALTHDGMYSANDHCSEIGHL